MKISVATIYYKSLPLISAVKMLARVIDVIMISPIYREEKFLKKNYED